MPSAPVALFVFNRPDLAAGALDAIRPTRPERLVLVADGPRADREGEANLCAQTRAAVTSRVDWDCDIDLVASAVNLGCGARVSSGITHVLEKYGRAIFIEDDVRPDPSFFPYCNQLLDRFATDERVGHIGGTSLRRLPGRASYQFSSLPLPWGWATWQRAWSGVDLSMQGWESVRDPSFFRRLTPSARAQRLLVGMFDAVRAGHLDTWDVQWWLHFIRNQYLSVQPTHNLVRNVGFGDDATHTASVAPTVRIGEPRAMSFPLRHPSAVEHNRSADRAIVRRYTSRRAALLRRIHRAQLRVAQALGRRRTAGA